MTEIKSYGRPPVLVEKVMEAVMILRGAEPTWMEAKRQLGTTRVHSQLICLRAIPVCFYMSDDIILKRC